MRNHKIDLLRFVGLSLIIFAHVEPPKVLFQLRNFDVPLMVLISGMSFGLAFKGENYLRYLWKRIKRLVFPVWIFLSVFFLTVFFFKTTGDSFNYSRLIASYLLVGGIGYVWIIRVFLLVALVSPFIYTIHRKTKNDLDYLLLLLVVLIIYEVIRFFAMPFISDGIGKVFSMVMFYVVPYSLIFALGLRISQMRNSSSRSVLLSFLFGFVGIGCVLWVQGGGFVPTQMYKYPPSIYYLSYAIAASIFFGLLRTRHGGLLKKAKTLKKRFFLWRKILYGFIYGIYH